MDMQMLSKGLLDYAKKRKRWVFLIAICGASSYGAYKVYNLPSLTKKRRRFWKLFRVFVSVAEMVSDSAKAIGFVCSDLKDFLRSDSDEIPKSLRQISKIARSDEFSESVSRMSEGLTVGILRGYRRESSGESEGSVNFIDRVLDRFFSNAGSGFASVVAGSFARNLVLGFYSNGSASSGTSDVNRMASVVSDDGDLSSMLRWVDVISSGKCKELMADCIQVFVSSAVAVYLEKTLHINAYDEVFAGLTNPNHESKVKDLLVSVCNGAVETFVKTSHHVLTSKNSNLEPSPSSTVNSDAVNDSSNDRELANGTEVATHLTSTQLPDQVHDGGWGNAVLSTLSVPRNRRFVIDVTGRVTLETFRSFIEFVSWKLSDGLRSGSNVVHDHVVDNGRRVVRYFGLKSYICIIVCLALYFHIISGTRALLPA